MKSKIVVVALSVLLVLSLFFNVILLYRLYRETRGPGFNAENEVLTGDIAPDFTVELLTGESFTLSEHRGTVVVLDFWATWCGPCVQKMPTVQVLSEQFENNVVFVGMNVGERPDRIRDFIAERGFTYHIGLDEDSSIHRNLYPSPGIPYTVIIDGNGMITQTFLGSHENMYEYIRDAILEALG
ncbi:MAG: TlpA family protein disulfide reductase [Defluviitaleaceae bacterium]|nr:TlpA family protein disulfide reductase [Defluviitaleaceae bacterium]